MSKRVLKEARARPGSAGALLLGLWLVFPLLTSGGCSEGEEGPEARLRRLFRETERAAEEKDLQMLKSLVSDRYADAKGYDKEAVVGLLRYHFLRNESIHLLTRISSLRVPEPGTAEAVVLAAMAGEPIPSVADPAFLRADLYRFSLKMEEEKGGAWQLVNAEWRRVKAGDFL